MVGRSLLVGLCLCLYACALDERPASGGLMVTVDSDLLSPKDLDHLRLDVTQGGDSLFHVETALDTFSGLLPREFRVRGTPSDAPVWVKAVASKDGRARIERSAYVTMPRAYLGLLRISLRFLCDGRVTRSGISTCTGEQTCVGGRCDSATIGGELPDYFQRSDTGMATSAVAAESGDASAGQSACFDVLACSGEATEVTPEAAGCTFPMPESVGDRFNVALRLPRGGAGACDDQGCWVMLAEGAEGFERRGGNVALPARVCELQQQSAAALRVAVSARCDPWVGGALCEPAPIARPPSEDVGSVNTGTGSLPRVGDACVGPSLQSCGQCGSRQRTCQDGLWSNFAGCADQGECAPDATESCGRSGTRVCGGDCSWSACVGETCEGPLVRACGECGTQRRRCEAGELGEWSACEGEGDCSVCNGDDAECSPGDVRSCGTGGTQACGGACRWDEVCAGQACEGAATRACGYCGSQQRSCDPETGAWSEWSACSGEGECAPDSTRSCGENGTQTCAGSCRWSDACTGQFCVGEATRSCGRCGLQIRRCDTGHATWSDWSECTDEGECDPGSTRTCFGLLAQRCESDCRWEAECPLAMCDGPAERACGRCGTQSRSCDVTQGRWSAWSECTDEGECKPGDTTTRECGAGAARSCSDMCRWSKCSCEDDLRTCGDACVDIRTDAAHCGACDNACGAEQTCVAGACSCAVQPGAALVACGATCVDTMTDLQNCGGCGVACVVGQSCVDGACACPAGQTACAGGCVDLTTDLAHCGACGTACPTDATCAAGTCECPARTTACATTCSDIQTDPLNCGACGAACPTGASCETGACLCPPRHTNCAGACSDVRSDPANCGACGRTCGVGAVCVNSACACPLGRTACGDACCAADEVCSEDRCIAATDAGM